MNFFLLLCRNEFKKNLLNLTRNEYEFFKQLLVEGKQFD